MVKTTTVIILKLFYLNELNYTLKILPPAAGYTITACSSKHTGYNWTL